MRGLRNDMRGWLYIEVAGFSGHVIPTRAKQAPKSMSSPRWAVRWRGIYAF